MDSILCKECKECLFINALQLIIQSSTKYKKWKQKSKFGEWERTWEQRKVKNLGGERTILG